MKRGAVSVNPVFRFECQEFQSLSSDAGQIAPIAGVYLDFVADIYKKRHLNLQTGFNNNLFEQHPNSGRGIISAGSKSGETEELQSGSRSI